MEVDKIKLVEVIASMHKDSMEAIIPVTHSVEIYYLDEKVKITRGVPSQTVVLEMSFDELIEDFLNKNKGMR